MAGQVDHWSVSPGWFGPPAVLLGVGLSLFFLGLVYPPSMLGGLALLVLALAWANVDDVQQRRASAPLTPVPWAWCPACGAPALWIPHQGHWYCSACPRYFSRKVAPPS